MSCSNFFRENKERGSNIGFVVGAKHVIDWRHLSLSVCPSIRSLALVGQNFYGLLIILIRPFSNATNAKCIWFWATYIHFWKKVLQKSDICFYWRNTDQPWVRLPTVKKMLVDGLSKWRRGQKEQLKILRLPFHQPHYNKVEKETDRQTEAQS